MDPLPLGISVALSGEGMDISWNYTLRNWGINISVAAVRDLNIPITFSSSKESLNFALPFSNRLFPLPFHFSSPLFYPCHGCVTSLLLEAWNCKICRTREWSLSRSWPLIKEENWAELTFAKTSGTVTKARATKKNRSIADRHVPSNDPRNTCGTHFSSSLRLVFKVANGSSWISEAPIPSFFA